METLLLGDANVIIDLVQCQATSFLLDIIRSGIASIQVLQAVMDEVKEEISEAELFQIGIKLASVTFDQMVEIQQMDALHNSEADKTLLVIGRDLPNACVWSNDGGLLKQCNKYGVKAKREFGVLLELVRLGIRTVDEIIGLARAIEEINPRMRGIVAQVKAQIG